MVLLAAVIAISIKLVGIILVTAMIIIPAASAQNLASSLNRMFVLSIIISLIAVIVGMLISAAGNLPSGPTIVLTSAACFALSFILKSFHVRV